MQKLIESLKKQLEIYEKLLEKTRIEKEAFNNKDEALFMSVLTERLSLMNEVSALEGEIAPLREEWINNRGDQPDDINHEIIGIVTEIKKKMDDILELESKVYEEKMKGQQEVRAVPKAKAVNLYKKI
ncbi:hypothetical protein ACFL2A_01945 [Thermodesulfobacteriota bacterium]